MSSLCIICNLDLVLCVDIDLGECQLCAGKAHTGFIANSKISLISKDNQPSIAWMCRICTFYFRPFHLGIDSDSSASIAQCQLPINIIPKFGHVSSPNEIFFNPSILNNSNLIGQTLGSPLPISPCNYKTLHEIKKMSGKLSATFTYLHVNARSLKRIFFPLLFFSHFKNITDSNSGK